MSAASVWGHPPGLEGGVREIAALLGEATGRCGECGRPVRLMSCGLVPLHYRSEYGKSKCPGSEQRPAEAGGSQ